MQLQLVASSWGDQILVPCVPEQLSHAVCCCREVFFETNGVPRTVEVVDRTDTTGQGGPARKAAREKADSSVLGSVGAPMAGEVIEVSAKPGLLSSWRRTWHFTE